jgi:hypothetical protein
LLGGAWLLEREEHRTGIRGSIPVIITAAALGGAETPGGVAGDIGGDGDGHFGSDE